MAERFLFWGLVALVSLAPLPLGSNRPWSWSLLALLAGVLLLGWAVAAALRAGPAPVAARRAWPVLLPFGLALLWAALQAWSGVPEAWTHPVWSIAGEALGRSLPGTISVAPGDVWDGMMRLLAYGAAFWLALQLCRDRRRARHALWTVVLVTGAYGLYGMIADLSGSNSLLWYDKWAYRDAATGPFVNRNSFATYLGIGLVAAVGLLIEAWLRALEFAPTFRLRLRRTIEALSTNGGLLLIAAILLTTLLLTGSRGGFAAACAGLASLLLIYGRRGGTGLRVFAVLLLLGSVALFALSGEHTAARFADDTTTSLEGRSEAYEVTLTAIDTAPLLGTGLGSFEEIFPLFQPFELPGNWSQAHNSYLENALELGLPAAVLLTLAVLLAVLHCLRGVVRRRRDRVFAVVAVAASLLVGSHALVDFSLQIPAVALTYAFLLGLGCAQSWRRDDLASGDRQQLPAETGGA